MATKPNTRTSMKEISLCIVSAVILIATFIFVITDGCMWAFNAPRSVQYAFNIVAILGIFPAVLYASGIIKNEE